MIKIHIFHCYYTIEGTQRKLKSWSKCTESNPYISGNHVRYITKQKCCICGKERISSVYWDYQIDRGLSYPSAVEWNDSFMGLERRIKWP